RPRRPATIHSPSGATGNGPATERETPRCRGVKPRCARAGALENSLHRTQARPPLPDGSVACFVSAPGAGPSPTGRTAMAAERQRKGELAEKVKPTYPSQGTPIKV